MEDAQLLQEYANGSESAFRKLVEKYINLVYSAALRRLENAQLAEDVVQTVFTALARKALGLPKDVLLGGWLYRHTCFVAAQASRTERRRQARERQAMEINGGENHSEPDWERLSPFLEEAMEHLRAGDRDAVVLRYLQGRNLGSVGSALGISEEAARKRISRALEKLRMFFARRGVSLSGAALASLLAAHAVVAAPAGMAAAVGGSALAAAGAGAGSTFEILKIIIMSKIKIGIIGIAVVAAVVTPLVLHYQSRARLRDADEALRHQTAQAAEARAENERLSSLLARTESAAGQSEELQRLRAEAGKPAGQTHVLNALRKENRRLQAAIDRPSVEPTEEQQRAVQARMSYGKAAVLSCMIQARTNGGRFPASFSQLAVLPERLKGEVDPTGDGFEIVYAGSFDTLRALTNVQDIIVIRQKEPSPYGNRWAKVYVCGDGHCEVHVQTESDFQAWEKQHTLPAP